MNTCLLILAQQAPLTRVNIIPLLLGVVIPAFLFVLVIIALVRIAKFFCSAGTDLKLTRIELGKLAEEVRSLREELKSHKGD